MRIKEIAAKTDYILNHTDEYIKQGQLALEQLKNTKGRKE